MHLTHPKKKVRTSDRLKKKTKVRIPTPDNEAAHGLRILLVGDLPPTHELQNRTHGYHWNLQDDSKGGHS
jgi:hypothetical protein